MIREGFLDSEKVAALSWRTECFFHRLLLVADDYGLFDARPMVLRTRLFPLHLDKVSNQDIQDCLHETEGAGLVRVYCVGGKDYVQIINFGQRRQSKPRFPLPPDDGDSPCNTVICGGSRETTVIHREPRNSTAYTETKSKTETYTDKQKNNAEGNNTVVCSDPPTASAYPEMEDQHSEKRTERSLPARFGSETEHDAHDGRNGPQGVSQASTQLFRERLNDVRGMRCADNHADLEASPGAARFMAATLAINPSWSRTLPTALEQAAALEAYRSAQGRVTPRDMEMLRDYYASGLTHDRSNKAFWRPDSRKKFWECFGDVLTHADRWAKETRWKPVSARKKPKPEAPRQPEGPVVDTDTAAEELREWRKELGLGG